MKLVIRRTLRSFEPGIEVAHLKFETECEFERAPRVGTLVKTGEIENLIIEQIFDDSFGFECVADNKPDLNEALEQVRRGRKTFKQVVDEYLNCGWKIDAA